MEDEKVYVPSYGVPRGFKFKIQMSILSAFMVPLISIGIVSVSLMGGWYIGDFIFPSSAFVLKIIFKINFLFLGIWLASPSYSNPEKYNYQLFYLIKIMFKNKREYKTIQHEK